jgi:hypothetical protein
MNVALRAEPRGNPGGIAAKLDRSAMAFLI